MLASPEYIEKVVSNLRKVGLWRRGLQKWDNETLWSENNIELVLCPPDDNFSKFLKQCSNADLVILHDDGFSLNSILKENYAQKEFKDVFFEPQIKKVAWSMDTHHQSITEKQLEPFFDRYYTAHSPYMNIFEKEKQAWLPCYFSQLKTEELYKLLQQKKHFEHDLVYLYQNYSFIGDRNAVAWEIRRQLEKTSLNFMFGRANYGRDYLQALFNSRIILNISIIDDLNLRNFEAWALNKILLTNQTPDHDLIQMDNSSTFYFDRSLVNFHAMLEAAWTKAKEVECGGQKIQTVHQILNHHMLSHRIAEIIKKELDFVVNIPEVSLDEIEEKSARVMGCSQVYSGVEIEAYSRATMALKAIITYLSKKNDARLAFLTYEEHYYVGSSEPEIAIPLLLEIMSLLKKFDEEQMIYVNMLGQFILHEVDKYVAAQELPNSLKLICLKIIDVALECDILSASALNIIQRRKLLVHEIFNTVITQGNWEAAGVLISYLVKWESDEPQWIWYRGRLFAQQMRMEEAYYDMKKFLQSNTRAC